MKEMLLYDEIYNSTKDFGRTQFVRELMRLERENKELKEQNKALRSLNESQRETCASLLKRIQKAERVLQYGTDEENF